MGVNVQCSLPANVGISDASEVIGILAGLPVETIFVSGGKYKEDWSYDTVPGVTIKGNVTSPTMADISIKGDLIDGEKLHYYYWHFEGSNGSRSFSPKSTPFWIAICKGLVEFFGGELVYNDCSDSICDYRKVSRYSNDSEGFRFDDGEDLYTNMQERKRRIKPLTLDDLRAVREHASYQTPEVFEEEKNNSEFYALLGSREEGNNNV